jgi:ABC-type Zn2+ transport system substrate-binding protein/surface adhesin
LAEQGHDKNGRETAEEEEDDDDEDEDEDDEEDDEEDEDGHDTVGPHARVGAVANPKLAIAGELLQTMRFSLAVRLLLRFARASVLA